MQPLPCPHIQCWLLCCTTPIRRVSNAACGSEGTGRRVQAHKFCTLGQRLTSDLTMVAPATYSLALSYEGVGGKGTEHWAYFLARTLHELRTGEKYQTAFEIEPEGVISHA